MIDRVLIRDPAGKIPTGTMLDGHTASTRARELAGADILPVHPDLVDRRIGGCPYTLMHWGSGWPFNANQGERGCPMLLYVLGDLVTRVHWLAEFERIPGETLHGNLLLVTNPNQPGGMQGGLVADDGKINLASAVEGSGPNYGGPWTVGGSYGLRVQSAGYLGLCLYAVARGMRVIWSAASLA